VQVRRAEALAHAGRGAAAADVYLDAAKAAEGEEAVELTRRAAEQLLLAGHLERGKNTINQVLATLGEHTTRDGYPAVLSTATSRALVRLRGLKHTVRDEAQLSSEELSRLDAFWTVACSLGVIDPLCGIDYQSRHLLLALRAGEPRRLLRAITLEASYVAISGADSEPRTTPLLVVADELVRRTGDEAARALLELCKGIVAHLQGRALTALTNMENALATLAERRYGAIWETLTAQRFVIASLFFLGRMRRLSEYVDPLLAQAEGTGNLYATMCFRTAYSCGAWLARDDVAEVQRQIARAREEWTTPGFQLCHCNILITETYLDLYTQDVDRAFHRLQERWRAIQAARFLRVGLLRVQLRQLMASVSVALASDRLAHGQRAEARELARHASRWIKPLRADVLGRAAPLADLADAAVQHVTGNRDGSRALLESAIAGFDREHMSLYSAAARTRLGQLLGGSHGAELTELASREFEREGVVEPACLIDMFAPGFHAEL
jgi:hypothetical protein